MATAKFLHEGVFSLNCSGTRFRFGPGESDLVRSLRQAGHFPLLFLPVVVPDRSSSYRSESIMHLWQNIWPVSFINDLINSTKGN